ncbi:MAG: TrkA family potassium uptake protein [Cyclobacteriaceae bacterium]|jgi:trk system potassium uptake protein TrkA
MNHRFAVIGLGQLGTSIALTLAERGAEVIAIDHDMEKVDRIKDEVAYAVALDATDPKALQAQDVHQVEAAVVAIGEDFEALVLTTVVLQELKVKRIITRAANEQQRAILSKLGIEEILSPEKKIGESVAEMLLQPSIHSFLSLSDEYEIVEISAPKRTIGQTLAQLNLRKEFNLNLITIKRGGTSIDTIDPANFIGVPNADTEIHKDDVLFAMGTREDIQRFIECHQ